MKIILLQGFADGMQQFLPLIGIGLVFYFFFIRPQNKQRKETQSLLENLQVGDKVISSGGIHGKILRVNETSFLIEIDKNTKITIEKASISLEMTKAMSETKKED